MKRIQNTEDGGINGHSDMSFEIIGKPISFKSEEDDSSGDETECINQHGQRMKTEVELLCLVLLGRWT